MNGTLRQSVFVLLWIFLPLAAHAQSAGNSGESKEEESDKSQTSKADAKAQNTNAETDTKSVDAKTSDIEPSAAAPLVSEKTGVPAPAAQATAEVAKITFVQKPSQDLFMIKTMGQPFGEGYFSLSPSAHRLQFSVAFDQALSVGLEHSKIGGHIPIFSTDVLLRLTGPSTGSGALWLGAAVKPLGVSRAYPHADRLAQRGQVIQSLSLMQHRQFAAGSMRLDAGIVSQHLGRSDTLYWSSLLPNRLETERLRLFDNALGLNAVYAYKQLYTRLDIGQPIERNVSPFASADGLRVQMVTGWVDGDSEVLVGGRVDRLNDVDEQELNLSWQLSLKRFSPLLPVMIYGEVGSITQPDVNEHVLGALYAHHEIALQFDKVQLRTRYDWIDRDTYFKYDTTHLVRGAVDFQVIQYVNLSAQYRHRWSNSEERASSDNDDIMLFVHLVY